MGTPTTITVSVLPNPAYTAINGETSNLIITGYLEDDLGGGVGGKTIKLYWETVPPTSPSGKILLTTANTAGSGFYTKVWPVHFGYAKIYAEFDGDGTYDPSSDTESIVVIGLGEADLRAAFWIAKYPTPGDIENDQYGAVLIIDPNGLRQDSKGPIEFLLDSATYVPGFTEMTGYINVSLNDNDNKRSAPSDHADFYLLREGTELIRDDDEFWIGVQRGPKPGGTDPIQGKWNATGGSDHKGAGRKIHMGGFISKRYYSIENKRYTAVITGKDYMDIWNNQPYGSATQPKKYSVAQDVGFIISDLITTINQLQTPPAPYRSDGWYYYPHPTYWPTVQQTPVANIGYGDTAIQLADVTGMTAGYVWVYDNLTPAGEYVYCNSVNIPAKTLNLDAPGITNLAGYHLIDSAKVSQSSVQLRWAKEFKQDAARDVMVEICEEALAEWNIDYLRYVRMFARNAGPTTAPAIRYGTNVRNVPSLIMGDTVERITHLITQGLTTTIPATIDLWCNTPNIWYDPTNLHRGYARYAYPPPANADLQIYNDTSLIIDDEGHSALCFQNDNVNQFNLNFGMAETSGSFQQADLQMDLREVRRLKFKFRHATYDAAFPANIYRIHIKCGLNDGWYYDFGKGTQETEGVSEHDTIDSNAWTEIDLLLPEFDEDAALVSLHNWVEVDDPATPNEPDPTNVRWPSIYCSLAEPDPGYGPGQNLTSPGAIGDNHIHVANPQMYAGLPATASAVDQFFYQVQCIEIVEGGTHEQVSVSSLDVGVLELQNPPLAHNFTVAAKAYVRAGWTICFSQFRFERQLSYTQEGTLAPPYRYGVMTDAEADKLNEIISLNNGTLEVLSDILYGVSVQVDGDPLFEVGCRPYVYFTVSLYENLRMVIDSATYYVQAGDFYIDLELGLVTKRSRRSSDYDVLAAHEKQLKNIKSAQETPRGEQ